MPTSVVTGGAGFLGSHLCERLVGLGFEVVAVDDFCTGTAANLSPWSAIRASGWSTPT